MTSGETIERKYTIVSEDSMESLIKKVNAFINQGYKLQGGVFITDDGQVSVNRNYPEQRRTFYQALTKNVYY